MDINSQKTEYKTKIKYLVMDVDGTLTDGKIYMAESGELFKAFSIKDGCGIKDILPQYDITPIIITARKSIILENRCRELNITELYQMVRNKNEILPQIIARMENCNNEKVDLATVAYIGDDILDIPSMQMIKNAGGIVGCPNDAVAQVKNISNFISTQNGGDGAVRDFIEFIVMNVLQSNVLQVAVMQY